MPINKPSILKYALDLELSGLCWGTMAVAYYKRGTEWVEFARAGIVPMLDERPGEYTIRTSPPRDVMGKLEVVVCALEDGPPPNDFTSDPVFL